MAVQKKIIHIDCDCFFAAIEMRDQPRYASIPLAVGGDVRRRGVISTCNYLAREYGVRSAMPSAQALKLCPDLLIVPPRMEVYRAASREIQQIFREYTELVEPLSLDEAYLDVSAVTAYGGSATRVAQAIRREVWEQVRITVSAGVASNKFLAKIASDWHKPDGLFVIPPAAIAHFVQTLAVQRLPGVGPVTTARLQRLGIERCEQLQQWARIDLIREFGRFGERLYQLARGEDHRPVEPSSKRQSVSVEHTYEQDLPNLSSCLREVAVLHDQLMTRFQRLVEEYQADKPFVKIKFHDFTQTTLEQAGVGFAPADFQRLLKVAFARGDKPVRLIGLGIRLQDRRQAMEQLPLDWGFFEPR